MSETGTQVHDSRSGGPGREGELPADWEHLLRSMLRIRNFEDQVKGLFGSGLVRGSTHLCQGQEAVSVGVCSLLEPGDAMTCTYRGHGAVLAAGAALDASFAEILGREGGLCGGKGGSMHLADFDKGIIGSNAIVGAQLPIALGAALAAQHKRTGKLSVAFTGDGSTNIGAFHESLNMAAVWRPAAGRRHREQPLRRVQPPCGHDGHFAPLRAGGRLRHPGGPRRRQRPARGATGHRRGVRPCPCGRRPDTDRGRHLPP